MVTVAGFMMFFGVMMFFLSKSYIVLNFSCRKSNEDVLKNKNLTIKNIEWNIALSKSIEKSRKLKKLNKYRHLCATIEQQGKTEISQTTNSSDVIFKYVKIFIRIFC